jgi:peroxiredoxin
MQIVDPWEEARLDLGSRLGVGDVAPDITVLDASGQSVSLAEVWRRGPLVLTFLRHFG